MQHHTALNALRYATMVFVALSFVALKVFSIGQVGSFEESHDGRTVVSAGSHPIMIMWAAVALGIFFAIMKIESVEVNSGIPTMKRRFGAFLIDFWFSLLVLAPLGALLPLFLEAERTGHFAWHFQRDYSVPSDVWGLADVIGTLGLMVLYFVFPLTKGKQTVGCFLLRLKVTPPFSGRGSFTFRSALRRTWYEFQGLCSWVFKGVGRDNQGRTWWDQQTNCDVVLINSE
jgi:RDD family protein